MIDKYTEEQIKEILNKLQPVLTYLNNEIKYTELNINKDFNILLLDTIDNIENLITYLKEYKK